MSPRSKSLVSCFSRPVQTETGFLLRNIEIAFSVDLDDKFEVKCIQPMKESTNLVVFFPTVLPTNLGFFVQGPYVTTPSRDNVPKRDPRNRELVKETRSLLICALEWLRDKQLLDSNALQCLPLDSSKFSKKNFVSSFFQCVKDALAEKPLLPCFGGGYTSGEKAILPSTNELRNLFSPSKVAALFGWDQERLWLSADITHDRTPELRRYMKDELDIIEITPEKIISKLTKQFLEDQPDDWILKLYVFLSGQQAQLSKLREIPLIRLEGGEGRNHVPAYDSNGQLAAFLPGLPTQFPTVKSSVCADEKALKFLQSLGLTEPNLVDDVILNRLPKYTECDSLSDDEYQEDIYYILNAFATDSKIQREKLIRALRETKFVRAVDTSDGTESICKPGEVYLATERLKKLLAGVSGILLVDSGTKALRGENVRSLLETCGVTPGLRTVRCASTFTDDELAKMRLEAGCSKKSKNSAEDIEDFTLDGLDGLLAILPSLDSKGRSERAVLLWDALGELHDRRGAAVFSGIYKWSYFNVQKYQFDAAFVRSLNESAWITDRNGELQRPEFVSLKASNGRSILSWNGKSVSNRPS